MQGFKCAFYVRRQNNTALSIMKSTKVQTLYCFICNTVESAYRAEGEIPPAVALVAAVLEDRGLFLVVVFGGHH